MKKNKKIVREYVDHGLGFPIVIRNLTMTKIHGEWVADIDYSRLDRVAMIALALKPARLTGAEIRFIRLQSGMTYRAFAERFGVTHPAVIKWEKAGEKAPEMAWACEKDIRLFVLDAMKVKPREFQEAYESFRDRRQATREKVEVPLELLAQSRPSGAVFRHYLPRLR